ncbi:tyrosine-type recombinase/integrase [Candidatus Enterococcus mansonii]|uniref:Tyr recombinase domain-containing protein n=1 Tax=Candidatus Enterococcus mansonii TaxID=1834181 RepID=A0A242CIT2_9ENTE|nr:site-specific integrase [Enterococcus sp. 4G2_DIV0659]OTO10145.1 hypothetical protein A5880_000828 [Enterococcus sp. 4G2_DIV0659]
MPKKGENIYKRKDGRWEGRYIKGRNKAGAIKYGYVYAKKYNEVKDKLIVVKAGIIEKGGQESEEKLLKDWCNIWFESEVKPAVKSSTFAQYQWVCFTYIYPFFENCYLHNIKRNDIQQFIISLERQNLAPGTIRNIFTLLKKILISAQNNHLLRESPYKKIRLPHKKKKIISALSRTDQRKLEEVVLRQKGCSAVMLSLYLGLRIGEISGLKWTDIDFKNEVVYIRRTVSRVKTSFKTENKTNIIISSPKTEQSYRVVPLSQKMVYYLLEKKKQSQSEYVIACKNGLAEPRVIRYRFKSTVKKAGIPNIHFHVLRHTFATRCIEMGTDITSLSHLLGHTSVKMTLDIYTDSMLDSRKNIVAQLDQLMIDHS